MISVTIEFTNGHQWTYEAKNLFDAAKQAIADLKDATVGSILYGQKIRHIMR